MTVPSSLATFQLELPPSPKLHHLIHPLIEQLEAREPELGGDPRHLIAASDHDDARLVGLAPLLTGEAARGDEQRRPAPPRGNARQECAPLVAASAKRLMGPVSAPRFP